MPRDKKQELLSALTDTEKNLKLIENYTDAVAVPILNEWRYATRHIVDVYFNLDDKDALDKAHGHFRRACYDSFGMLMTYQLAKIDNFHRTFFGYAGIVRKYIENYNEWQIKVDEARRLYDMLPETNEKDGFYEKVKAVCGELQGYIRILNATQNSWMGEVRSQKHANMFKYIVGIATIIGVIAGIVFACIQ